MLVLLAERADTRNYTGERLPEPRGFWPPAGAEEQRDEPPGAMGKRQDDKGQGHEILPGNAVMPVPLTRVA